MSVITKINDQTISLNNNTSCLRVPREIYNGHILSYLSDKDVGSMDRVAKGAVTDSDRLARLIATGFMNLKALQNWVKRYENVPFNHEISLDFSSVKVMNYQDILSYLIISSQNKNFPRFPKLIRASLSYSNIQEFHFSSLFYEDKQLFQNLRHLNLSYCNDLTNDILAKIGSQCSNLIKLKLSDCHTLAKKVSFENYSKLENLDLSDCDKINEITLNNQSTQLKTLTIWKVVIEKLDFLAKVSQLENFTLGYSNDLKDADIEHINKHCTNLTKLRLYSRCMRAARLEKLTRLESLQLGYCNNITLSTQNAKLQTLLLSNTYTFNSLDFFQKAPNLKKFTLFHNHNLQVIDTITQYCSNLIDLALLSCAGLVNAISLTTLSKLERLCLKNCENITNITLHPQITSLKILHLDSLKKLNSFDSLNPQIEEASFLNVGLEATDLQDIFKHCSNLTKLHLSNVQLRRGGSYTQREISLEKLSRLKTLDVNKSDIRTILDFENKTYRVIL